MSMPIISVIVPVYNVEKYLSKCLESILNQSFSQFELILVNDGSTDNSELIFNKYLYDKRLIVINKSNGGLSSARNAGLDVARGEYIIFIDSDDYINNKMFEILYNEMIRSKSDIIICDYLKVSESENEKIIDMLNYKSEIIEGKENILNQLCSEKRMQFTVAWNKLYKKKLFESLRFEEGRLHEDEFIAHRILGKAQKVNYIDLKLYYYVQRNNSIMQSQFKVNRLDCLDAIYDRIKYCDENNLIYLKGRTIKIYVDMFFYYYKEIVKVFNNKFILVKLKEKVRKIFLICIKSRHVRIKEKLLVLIFIINSKLYEKIIK